MPTKLKFKLTGRSMIKLTRSNFVYWKFGCIAFSRGVWCVREVMWERSWLIRPKQICIPKCVGWKFTIKQFNAIITKAHGKPLMLACSSISPMTLGNSPDQCSDIPMVADHSLVSCDVGAQLPTASSSTSVRQFTWIPVCNCMYAHPWAHHTITNEHEESFPLFPNRISLPSASFSLTR